jgi:hypothetical protein
MGRTSPASAGERCTPSPRLPSVMWGSAQADRSLTEVLGDGPPAPASLRRCRESPWPGKSNGGLPPSRLRPGRCRHLLAGAAVDRLDSLTAGLPRAGVQSQGTRPASADRAPGPGVPRSFGCGPGPRPRSPPDPGFGLGQSVTPTELPASAGRAVAVAGSPPDRFGGPPGSGAGRLLRLRRELPHPAPRPCLQAPWTREGQRQSLPTRPSSGGRSGNGRGGRAETARRHKDAAMRTSC